MAYLFITVVNGLPRVSKSAFSITPSTPLPTSREADWRLPSKLRGSTLQTAQTRQCKLSLLAKRCVEACLKTCEPDLSRSTNEQRGPALYPRRLVLLLIAGTFASPVAEAMARVVIADPDAGSKVVSTPSGLKYYDFVTSVKPDARRATTGDTVTIEYTLGSTGARNGWLIEASTEHPPLTFTLGANHDAIVRGLHEGVVGMRVEGRRRLLIPASLGYIRPNDQPIPKGFAEFQRFKNIYLNPDRPYKPDLVIDVTLMKINS